MNDGKFAKTELSILPAITMKTNKGTKSLADVGNYPIDLSNPPRKVKINGVYDSYLRYWFEPNVSSKVPAVIRKDILAKDGWEVIYNTIREYNLSTGDHTTKWPIIGLYNKYRGIFRFFYYHPVNTQGTDLVGILGLEGVNNSKIFNHATVGESYPINTSQKYKGIISTSLSSSLKNISGGLTINHWYCFEFDVSCYDPNISSGVLTFALNSIQRSNFKMEGGISGDIAGSIVGGVPSSGSLLSIGNLYSKKTDNSVSTTVNLEVNGANADAVGTSLQNKANNSSAGIDVKNLFKGIVKDGVGALKKGISSFMSSGISGLFSSLSSSLFGSSSPSVQQVKLQANLDLEASGTITTTTTILSYQFEMPNKRIGLLHLSSAPTVKTRESVRLNSGLWNPDTDNVNSYMITHLFGTKTCDVVVNPDVANEVNVYTTAQVLYINKSSNFSIISNNSDRGADFTWGKQKYPYRSADIVGLDKETEIWSSNIIALPYRHFDHNAYQNYKSGNKDFIISEPLNKVYLKVNYRITPKNGAETFYLQKVYKANVLENNTSNPFPSNWVNILWGTGGDIGDPGY